MTGPVRRDGRTRFARFCLVGATGFAVDAGLLLLILRGGLLGPVAARFLSFGAAVLITFALNRLWSFRVGPGDQRSFVGDLIAYLGVQGFGFLCNLVIYTVALAALPDPWSRPLPCLALASGAALIVNYFGSDLIVFRRRRT